MIKTISSVVYKEGLVEHISSVFPGTGHSVRQPYVTIACSLTMFAHQNENKFRNILF